MRVTILLAIFKPEEGELWRVTRGRSMTRTGKTRKFTPVASAPTLQSSGAPWLITSRLTQRTSPLLVNSLDATIGADGFGT